MNANEIREYRKSIGISQRDMSVLFGLGMDQIGRYERGEQPSRSVELLLLAGTFYDVLSMFLKLQDKRLSPEGRKRVEEYLDTNMNKSVGV